MSYLLSRNPRIRLWATNFGSNFCRVAAMATVALLLSCSSKESQSGTDSGLVLQDTPGQAVAATGQSPTVADVDKNELTYRSNRWSEVKPEMRAYIDINRGDTKSTQSPGPGDTAASAIKSETPAEAKAATVAKTKSASVAAAQDNSIKSVTAAPEAAATEKSSQAKNEKVSVAKAASDSITGLPVAPAGKASAAAKTQPAAAENVKGEVIDKNKRDLASMPEPPAAAGPVQGGDKAAQALESNSSAEKDPRRSQEPTGDLTAQRHASDPNLRKAIEETNRRAMLENGESNSDKIDPVESAEAKEPLKHVGTKSSPLGFAPLFAVLAGALIAIVAIRGLRREKDDPNK